MKKLRWQILVVILTLVVVGVLLLTQQPGQKTSDPLPTTGGIYTEALIGSLSRLNPLIDQNNPPDRDIDRLIFSGLIKFDSGGVPMPDLSDSWGVSQDGKIYNFPIRSNAVWHDGQPVTSDDVIFTLEMLKSDSSLFPQDVRDMWKKIEVTRVNEKNIRFVLPEPFAPFLDYLTFGVLPKHLLEGVAPDQLAAAPFNLDPIGTGPYRFERLILENGQVKGVELRVFDRYYDKKPYIEQIIFHYYPTSAAGLEAYRQGQVLGISQITPDILPQALVDQRLSLYTSRLPELSMVFFNLNNAEVSFFQDAALRRALLMSINRQMIVNKIFGGQAILAHGPVFPNTWAYYENIEHIDYLPEDAISLMKENGYKIPGGGQDVRADKEGKLLEFTMIHPDDALHTAVAELIQQNWAAVDVKVTLEALPYDTILNTRLATRSYEAALVDLNLARSPDPDPYPFWHQSEVTGGQNYSQWDDRSASEYIEQARIDPDLNIRSRLYRNFQVVFAKEFPALPLYFPVSTYGVDQQVLGVQVPALFDPSDRFLMISDWYLVTRRTGN